MATTLSTFIVDAGVRSTSVKIVVLVKQVPDTWGERSLDSATGILDRTSGDNVIDEISERSLEVALRVKDDSEAEVVVWLSYTSPSPRD